MNENDPLTMKKVKISNEKKKSFIFFLIAKDEIFFSHLLKMNRKVGFSARIGRWEVELGSMKIAEIFFKIIKNPEKEELLGFRGKYFQFEEQHGN